MVGDIIGWSAEQLVNPKKFEMAKKLGCTACFNPKEHEQPMQQALLSA